MADVKICDICETNRVETATKIGDDDQSKVVSYAKEKFGAKTYHLIYEVEEEGIVQSPSGANKKSVDVCHNCLAEILCA